MSVGARFDRCERHEARGLFRGTRPGAGAASSSPRFAAPLAPDLTGARPDAQLFLNSQLSGAEPKGVSRPSRGADGLQRQSLETQAAVGADAPTREGAVGTGPAASREVSV